MPATIAELCVADDPAAWRGIGFDVSADGRCRIGTVVVRLDADAAGDGIVSWAVRGASTGDVDGLPTIPSRAEVDEPAIHANGVRSIDHVVVVTPDLDRTIDALTDRLGLELRRTRDVDNPSRPMRQAFFRMGEVILEVVGPRVPEGDGPARFFGLALVSGDLFGTAEYLGPDRLSRPKTAVQPGRHIATVRPAAGLRIALAIMDPEPRR